MARYAERHGRICRRFGAAVAVAVAAATLLDAQIPGRNVNMVSGRTLPFGDPFLQRQNEPSIAASTRNPLHLLAGANDYRTVDLPGLPDSKEVGDAWMGLFTSTNGGATWTSTLMPGYPQDPTRGASPLGVYAAAADPVVRAGTNGLFYYSGIVFDRTTPNGPTPNGKSALFVSRLIDNNNLEAGNPIVFLDTKLVATNDGTAFIDKPWFVVDIPRTGAQTCTINTTQPNPRGGAPITTTQTFAGGAAYAAYSVITGEGTEVRSQIYLSRSLDCGATWSAPQQISSSLDPINQGATLAIDPGSGALYLAWRRFTADGTDDSIMVTRSLDQGRKWDPPGRARRFPRGKKVGLSQEIHGTKFKQPTELTQLASLDQPTAPQHFRTNAYPTMAIDGSGRVYVAWSERGFALNNDPDEGDARILVATSTNGASWSNPILVDNGPIAGHQIMPSIAFAGGKLMIAYYDFQEDVSGVFTKFVDEILAVLFGQRRHTVDVRAAMAAPGITPAFGPSVRVSEYLFGSRNNQQEFIQLQFNPPNLKLFQLGMVPFFGDYIDLTPSPSFVPTSGGGWTYNTAPASSPLFHVVWTDNRDVVPPADGNWANYAPPGATAGAQSYYDGSPLPNSCVPSGTPTNPNNRAGMRNQNIYTARITGGLVAGSPGNTKPLDPVLPRGFAVFAQNATELTKIFRLTIESQPAGGAASFLQASLLPSSDPSVPPPPHLTVLDVMVPRRSTIARNVYAISSIPNAQMQVSVKEIAAVGGNETVGGLQTTVVLNPDISNPDISNPDISNPDISNPDISNAEVHNPDISNPDISNPDISNPDISNPDISNPDISNVQVANPDISNPDISNPDISNPDISNPDISNPDISNPDISNPDISNQSVTDTTWTVTNDGNTTTSYSIQLLLNGTQPAPNQVLLQLILHKVYTTPAAVNCALVNHTHNQLLSNIIRPEFTDPADVGTPDISNPDISNATLWLAPGESAKITLRVRDWFLNDTIVFNAAQQVTPIVVPQALDVALEDGVLVVGDDVDVAVPLNAEFLNLPAEGVEGVPLGTVGVRVMDEQGGVIPGVNVSLSVRTLPGNAQIGVSQIALTNEVGVASFAIGALPVGTYRLLAQVTAPGVTPASAWSDSFAITARDVRQWTLASGGNGNYYEYVRVTGLSWTEARDAAAARSFQGIAGRLVTIGSAAENAFVTALSDGGTLRAWIGLWDPDGPDDISLFGWITGEPLTYTNWSAGEPNNPNTEFWVELFEDGTWNNNVVSDPIFPTLGYIVEYQLAPPAFVVSSTADSGTGTLRQAILNANANGPSPDTITFNLPGEGAQTIALTSALPAITQPLIINGATQSGFSGSPLVFVSRSGTWTGPGLRVEAANTVIRSLGIIGFGGPGIQLWSGANLVVAGNYIGINSAGTATANTNGVQVHSIGSRIGGAVIADRNVISGNTGSGILLTSDSGGTVIDMNYIGTNPAGMEAVPNGAGGIVIDETSALIGGTSASSGNVISGNTGNGILISNGPAGLTIKNNYLGIAADGVADLGNTANGIRLNGNTTGVIIGAPAQGNVISRNAENGVYLDLDTIANVVTNNLIGTDVSGTLRRGNGTIQGPAFELVGAGIVIAGAENQIGGPSQANVISANGTGISLTGTADANVIQGNLIGTTANGMAALGNRFGIFNAGAAGTQIGGTVPGQGNTVSGNSIEGISVTLERASDVRIEGNRIGTNASGTGAISGHQFGAITVRFEARATIGRVDGGGNLIAGNNGTGIRLETNGNTVENNIIGLQGIPNGLGGISITGSNNTVLLNQIAFNTGVGITASGSGNGLDANFIFSNGGLGIDQGGDGVTPNDGAAEEDGVQNYPVLASATFSGGILNIQGALSSTPQAQFQITFFVSESCDNSMFGEGQNAIGSLGSAGTNADGNLSWNDVNFSVAVTPGQVVTAIARNRTTNNTSEFSQCVPIETTGGTSAPTAVAWATNAMNTTASWRRPILLVDRRQAISGYRR